MMFVNVENMFEEGFMERSTYLKARKYSKKVSRELLNEIIGGVER